MPRSMPHPFRAAAIACASALTSVALMAPAPAVRVRPALQAASDLAHEHVLYAFRGKHDGAMPVAGLLAGAQGVLYGTALGGGGRGAGGVAFKLTPTGSRYTQSVLHVFRVNGSDGYSPYAALIADSSGLYGTTSAGGRSDAGTVFKLTPTGGGRYHESVLYAFRGGNDGYIPLSRLYKDTAGALYGTTFYGGSKAPGCPVNGCGTVYKLTPSGAGYAESIIYRFPPGAAGSNPDAGVIGDGSGALYGTTTAGGTGSCSSPSSLGCGVIFKLTPSGEQYKESVLYSFQGGPNDGAAPGTDLIADKTAIYGTTYNGGSSHCYLGCGVVFKLTPAPGGYEERVLYKFQGGSDGASPSSGVISDGDGGLYGTTFSGGATSLCGVGCGVVYELTPSGQGYREHVLYTFQVNHHGLQPSGGLIADASGALYGTTEAGGTHPNTCVGGGGCGVVYRLRL